MAPSVDITKSASLPLNRKRKAPADSSSSSNDTASVAAVPTKTVESLKATNGTNDSVTETIENGTNGTNGASEVKVSTETNGSTENGTAAAETVAQEEIITSNVALTTQEIHETSISTETVDRSFICSSHFRPARFPEVIGPLPFPKDLRKLVAWSDAFVTRLGWEALQAQESIEVLDVNLKAAFEARGVLENDNRQLQQSLNEEKDQLRVSKAENLKLQAIIKALEEQREKDAETIRGHLKKISDLEAANFTLDNENDKLEALSAELKKRCEEYIEELAKRGKDREDLIADFERWYEDDKIRDDKREQLNNQLQARLKIQVGLTTKAIKERDEVTARVKMLEAKNGGLTKELGEAVKALLKARAQIQVLMKKLATAEGDKAALVAELHDVTTRESNAQLEIEKLRGLLNKAKADFEIAKKDVAEANEHSKKHWQTLESIRLDGDWLLKKQGDDPCEWATMKPICTLGDDESRPVLADPFICKLPTADSVILKSAPTDTSVEASA